MKEEIEILNPYTGKPVIIEIEEKDWTKGAGEDEIAIKKTVVCFAYMLSFTRNKRTGEMHMVYYEETKSD